MPRHSYLHEITDKLENVFVSSSKVEDDEVKSHLARYLCMMTSGYIEEALKIIIRNYLNGKANQPIKNFVNTSIKRSTNFNFETICQFLGAFDNTWRLAFENQVSTEEKLAIDSIKANRDQIAHGRNVGVSFSNVNDWYKNAKNVIEKINSIVN